ncbi:PorV/PorQ family protein [candidate division KSB1 bacterium]|nr:PorV/PorQ family protein [candidate division KSB1 bacterium]
MKAIYITFLIIFVVISFTPAQFSYASEMAGFDFLRTQVGARPTAMAGAFVTISNDVNAIYFNPAGIGDIDQKTVSTTYLNHVLDFNSGFIGYAHPVKKLGTLGIGINYIDYGSFDRTNKDGKILGNFGANSFVIAAAIGRPVIPGLLAGANVKYIRSVIDNYAAAAFAIDCGVIYEVPFTENLYIGLALLNVGQETTAFIETKDKLPSQIVAGFSKRLAHLPLLFSFNAYKYVDDDFQFIIGGEFTLSENVFLRLGYNSFGRDQQVEGDLDRVAGASAGLGFQWRQYVFDYSLSSIGEVGSLNRITFSTRF